MNNEEIFHRLAKGFYSAWLFGIATLFLAWLTKVLVKAIW